MVPLSLLSFEHFVANSIFLQFCWKIWVFLLNAIPQYWGGGRGQRGGRRRHGRTEVHHGLQSREEERVDYLDLLTVFTLLFILYFVLTLRYQFIINWLNNLISVYSPIISGSDVFPSNLWPAVIFVQSGYRFHPAGLWWHWGRQSNCGDPASLQTPRGGAGGGDGTENKH